MRERNKRGCVVGSVRVYHQQTSGATWSFQYHRLPVLTLNCHGSKLTFCAATITFRKELYCDLGLIIAIELKRKRELGPWD